MFVCDCVCVSISKSYIIDLYFDCYLVHYSVLKIVCSMFQSITQLKFIIINNNYKQFIILGYVILSLFGFVFKINFLLF